MSLPWLTFPDISRHTPAPGLIRSNQAARARRSPLARARGRHGSVLPRNIRERGPMHRRIADRGAMRFWQSVYDQAFADFRVSHTVITVSHGRITPLGDPNQRSKTGQRPGQSPNLHPSWCRFIKTRSNPPGECNATQDRTSLHHHIRGPGHHAPGGPSMTFRPGSRSAVTCPCPGQRQGPSPGPRARPNAPSAAAARTASPPGGGCPHPALPDPLSSHQWGPHHHRSAAPRVMGRGITGASASPDIIEPCTASSRDLPQSE